MEMRSTSSLFTFQKNQKSSVCFAASSFYEREPLAAVVVGTYNGKLQHNGCGIWNKEFGIA